MIKVDEYQMRIRDLRKLLDETAGALDIETLRNKLQTLRTEQEKPEVWQDLEKSKQIGREISVLESKIGGFDKTASSIEDSDAMLQLILEENDESMVEELEGELQKAEEDMEQMRIRSLLRGKYDANDAIMTLHSGAGGTEACDWTEMLYRMYMMYCDKKGYKLEELDRLDGDEAGIKSVTFTVSGVNAYGYLKAEKGVHRLVRISPFDSNARRQTSFSSVEVIPEIEEDNEIKISPDELKVDTYRSSGAGGQHVNKTESAIRITHLPTGIIVACQNERSQIQNRERAMKMLISKLIEKREADRLATEQSIKGEIKKIEWGSQIRSYVFCPYTMVKDHRTGCETADVQGVMDGNVEPFIVDYLKKS
ncbi:MAG: peptide chain release factor 2 [Clostridia bacterium]|jgi:peptide chain release factor 2|nr:peptide chain release factor 2 [Clostridia bacterium]MBQ5801434.1 peptide chain release factor 2 [Clostridia bacterium]